ncbi:two-component system response regulator [Massilia sp. Root418]|uniref:sigma-54-dependent transcriptional regulator n=1 Tax=Massilia sp. Root418 TaxID=1736532 RepID=UPI0006F20E07|nr:sigma-54 dependent transcriptional regulator [Massilia sp. Root418]KQW90099.1 two-component system response regulator [Massilia sp. Root418]
MAPSTAHILILDDDTDVACAAQMLLRRRYGTIATLNDPAQLPAYLARSTPDVVLLDFNFTPGRIDGAEGLALLDVLRGERCAVIALTAYADVPLAVEALKRGACDFITKPWDNARLVAAVDAALARRAAEVPARPAAAVAASSGSGGATAALMGDSPAMRSVKAMIASVGPTGANVMVLGENGVGKELVARAIHLASQRAAGTFLAVDMGALPESTFESELFGHRKGSFTDAKADRAGRFQAARGGSLFLDEIGNMPLAAQAKLLTVLERREVTPIGADKPEPIDVRIISATNLDEVRLFDPNEFRPDLLFRLNTIVIRVPPLRERREDIPGLLRHYLDAYERQYQRPARAVAGGALAWLEAHPWPGNVRALRHACERAVILGSGSEYEADDFGLTLPAGAHPPVAAGVSAIPGAAYSGVGSASGRTGASANAGAALAADAAGDDLTLNTLERDAIATALAAANGNISRTARMLGVSRAALYRKLGKHGI